MYNINVKTIPHEQQRYDTIGDWWTEGGVLQVRVSSMGNADYEFLVAIHELIEKQICRKLGITEQMVDAWDLSHEGVDEPGELDGCPYREAHLIAEGVERAIAVKLGVDWQHYSKMVHDTMAETPPPEELNRHGSASRKPGNRVKMATGKVKDRSVLKGR